MLLRRDAQVNREALLAAAEIGIAQHGYDVPLDTVRKIAKLGRATFYRNFADRTALARALLDRQLDRLQAVAASLPASEDAFFLLLGHAARGAICTGRLIEGLRRAGSLPKMEMDRRIEDIYRPFAEAAKRAGLLRQDFSQPDLHRILSMLLGSIDGTPSHERAPHIERCLSLVTHGIRARD
ncbi:TetR/AcrR family transcriptional regulator [Rhizobium halophilum]|uniref:TetR/AcrR family transcriptional regulator n=1 Tax=Rhizobium halophilum TaxID=2846852 RepID=UPI001EFCE4AF|nr:TetR family transcriptional regulator [Rhizobium halophilum]MCF6371240.1 TetR/AcrR family transcriptional regulator [Rhizobium halophilum]